MEQSFPTQIDSSVTGILSSEYVALVVESDKGVNGYKIVSDEKHGENVNKPEME